MNKGVKKLRLRKGQDATQATVRKLVINFIATGRVKTTVKRAKIIKSQIDTLVHKAQDKTEASKNVLLRRIGDQKVVTKLIDEVGPHFKTRTSGFVKMVRMGARVGDGAEVALVEWIEPFIVVKADDSKNKKSQVGTADLLSVQGKEKKEEPQVEKNV